MIVLAGTDKHKWEFNARFRRHAFGWRSQPAIQRVKEAVAEIKSVARKEPFSRQANLPDLLFDGAPIASRWSGLHLFRDTSRSSGVPPRRRRSRARPERESESVSARRRGPRSAISRAGMGGVRRRERAARLTLAGRFTGAGGARRRLTHKHLRTLGIRPKSRAAENARQGCTRFQPAGPIHQACFRR